MDDKSYKVEEMLNDLIDLASEEVRKAKQKGYFGKDLAESVCCVLKVANMSSEKGGRYYERGNGEFGHYPEDGEYGEYGEYGRGGEYGARSGKGQRYGRSGQRYG